MGSHITKTLLLPVLLLLAFTTTASVADQNPRIRMETSKGDVVIELYPDRAPLTVENFLRYVNDGAYDETIFHRVMPGFMNQGGAYTPDLKMKDIRHYEAVKNEADNGLKNLRGTIAMARQQDPDSARYQFFINTADNAFLDYQNNSPQGRGYTVFGKVTDGMETMDRISKVKTGGHGPFRSDAPLLPVEIYRISVIDQE